ncbi:hypothetical protein Q9L58_010093 [Maublancomyces gigas]|uniref:Uncharacterized protein n=1 Tax=Discina gigas TaxID=1032678 RepID=A0ABR3G572_9PEZI
MAHGLRSYVHQQNLHRARAEAELHVCPVILNLQEKEQIFGTDPVRSRINPAYQNPPPVDRLHLVQETVWASVGSSASFQMRSFAARRVLAERFSRSGFLLRRRQL